MAAAHGAQILLSEAAVRALGKGVPDGISFRPLGVHHLRGVANEALYQVVVPDLPADFPPIRAPRVE
jgi:class 3 adenylate cyclase